MGEDEEGRRTGLKKRMRAEERIRNDWEVRIIKERMKGKPEE
jgi:hypothetical protein